MIKIFKTMLFMLLAANASAGEWHQADIEMSDGKTLNGELAILGSRPLTMILTVHPMNGKYFWRISFPSAR